MSGMDNINTAPLPSSFDDDPDFFEENRWKKFKRRIYEEPLIPLGCALTCWALFEAGKSIKTGDKVKTNRMFRRRIYAQGFTILAMLGGSAYWEEDRKRRKTYQGLVDQKDKKEKHDAWIRELEARDEEEQELTRLKQKMQKEQRSRLVGQTEEKVAKAKDTVSNMVKSAMEENERQSPILSAARDFWLRQR